VAEPDVPDDVNATTIRSESPGPPSALPPSLYGVRILLVEDEEDTRHLFRDALEGAGAQVRAVANGAAALRETDSWEPDLLVADLGLPGMDGYELLRTLRSAPSKHVCPAVAVSAYARVEDRSRALAEGFHAHIAKPVEPDALVLALRTVLMSTD
jgi:CheY-like chemotaxis protein